MAEKKCSSSVISGERPEHWMFVKSLMWILDYTLIMSDYDINDNYRLYMEHAHEMLQAAKENLGNDHYSSACNRAYYGCFYAASALLYSKGMSYGKHSAVIAAFRKNFIKTGEFDTKWSKIYELVMTSRHVSDYELNLQIDKEQAAKMIVDAEDFIQEVETWLHKHQLI